MLLCKKSLAKVRLARSFAKVRLVRSIFAECPCAISFCSKQNFRRLKKKKELKGFYMNYRLCTILVNEFWSVLVDFNSRFYKDIVSKYNIQGGPKKSL